MPASSHLSDVPDESIFPIKFPDDREGIQRHLKEILEGEAFRGSNRSGQFLKYIIEETISGRQENLKERILGIEIFGRAPNYDTGEDAIVRVTASEVRKRLLQHYGRLGTIASFRFSLPPGSYVPRITREQQAEGSSVLKVPPSEAVAAVFPASNALSVRRFQVWTVVTAILFVSNIAIGFAFWQHVRLGNNPRAWILPWSAILSGSSPPLVITSDPNIAEVQGFTREPISLSDYANHKYVSHPELLTAEQNHFCNVILRGDKASTVDSPIVAMVAAIAAGRSKSINVRGARMVQLSDLQGDSNLIILGSPRSNPWANLFNDRLDFRFEYDRSIAKEVIRNVHPRPGEASTYVATAPGWATGESYALIALLQNPDGNRRVLLLAGENGEGTEAAGKLLNDDTKLHELPSKCGIDPAAINQNFEVLLHLKTLAGSPSDVDAIACHIM